MLCIIEKQYGFQYIVAILPSIFDFYYGNREVDQENFNDIF